MEPHDEADRGQRAEQPEVPEEGVDHVEVGAGGGGQHRHGQVHVDILQVGPDGGLAGMRIKDTSSSEWIFYRVTMASHY